MPEKLRLLRLLRLAALLLAVLVLAAHPKVTQAAEIPLTIIHTNDIHSHFKPDKGPFGLGGIGRIATTVRRIRASVANSLLLDGGDWSEGQIYYNLDAGRTAIEMMNTLGYDAAVIGNHDWLNGPDQLLKLFNQVRPQFPILGSNLDFSKYERGAELSQRIVPYKILNVGALKVAVIGVVTYELIYDRWFAPIEIRDPFGMTRKLAQKLKKEADLVVLISHNGLSTNKLLASLPGVDVVIHAHDHAKLPRPLVVERGGKSAILVEAEKWGAFVGRLDLVVDTQTKKYTVANYDLIQMDDSIPEDPSVMSLVANYDRELEQKYGDIFHDHLADSTIDVRREGPENLFTNLLTDAYREYTGADVSFEQTSLTSGELQKGPIHTVDLYNALTAIWNPMTGKAWTLKTARITGETLSWIMNLILGASSVTPAGMVGVSGIHAIYDPAVLKDTHIRQIEIGGKPIEMKRQYLVAMPEGINQAIDFMEERLGNKIERLDFRDTGVEDWKVLRQYVARHSPIDSNTIGRGGRITVLQSDLGLYHDEISTSRRGGQVFAKVTVRNFGSARSVERTISVGFDKTPESAVNFPNPSDARVSFAIPPIAPGDKAVVSVALTLPLEYSKKRMPIYFWLNADRSDPNKFNDGTWLMLETDGSSRFEALPPLVSSAAQNGLPEEF